MLRQLDDEVDRLASFGWRLATLCIDHPYAVAFLISTALAALFWPARGQPRWIALAVCAAAWAQAALLGDRIVAGVILYGIAAMIAYGAGRSADAVPRASTSRRVDVVAVATLVTWAGLLRLYAIEAIPWFVDVEPAGAFLESLSSSGLSHFITHNRVLDDGFVHMPIRWLANNSVGPSILALRITSASLGALSVALCYAAARQFVGPAWAFAAGMLLATDPAHLFWSRIEASQIIAVTTAAFATLLVTVWLARRWSVAAAAAAMLWMPLTRYFYAAGLALAALPLLSLSAGDEQTRHYRLRAVPWLLVGCVLWFYSSPLLNLAATGEWQPVSTLSVYGRSMFELHDPHNEHAQTTAFQRLGLRARRLADNVSRLMIHLAHHRETFSNWLMMAQPDHRHRRSLNAVVFALLIPSIAYLLGTIRRSERVVLVLWLILLLPAGLFSEDPEPRRVAGFMAGIYLPIVVLLSDTSKKLGRPLHSRGRIVATICVLLVGGVAITNAACHFRIDREPPAFAQYAELAGRAFHDAGTIFHNIEDEAAAATLVYANAATFTRRLPCLRFVADWEREWSAVTTETRCSFESPIYDYLVAREALSQRTNAPSGVVAYLLEIDSPSEVEILHRLRERFPSARVERRRLVLPPRGQQEIVLLTHDPDRANSDRRAAKTL